MFDLTKQLFSLSISNNKNMYLVYVCNKLRIAVVFNSN